jgi:3-hydroxymyristoyl/3-hydroxydecanoyl-(acyl carrier protein) dehydratase
MSVEANGVVRTLELVVGALRMAAPKAEIDIVVPTDLRYFEGHFAGAPIVPGVVQIKWALELARRYLDVGGGFRGIENLKFQQLMVPGTQATLVLEYAADAGKLRFSFAFGEVRYSSGRLLLRPPP